MPAIPRKTQKVFGSALTPAGNVAVWGSLQAGAPAFSNDPNTIQSLANFLSGINGAMVGNKSVAVEDLNGLFLLMTQQLAYLLQAGVPDWDAGTTYFVNNVARVGGNLYISLVNNNLNANPTTDTNSWSPLVNSLRGASVAAAWVEFDGINSSGGNAVIHSSFNVDHVVRNEDGSYTVYFITPMVGENYVWTGSVGSGDGGGGEPFGAGDNGLVVGNMPGKGNAIHSAAACRVFTIASNGSQALVTPGNVSVIFYSR